ncbi:MAG: polyprenol monophosphomannose synthase [bacterium]|nr:polyprenol monophosphomannose synthase [bacterium]
MRDVIVIPTYNERESIAGLLEAVFAAVPAAHVLVIDDSSPDGTAKIVVDLRMRYPQLDLLVRPKKSGLGSAYIETFKRLVGDDTIRTITTMDADWSHNPAYLPRLFGEHDNGYDVVIGSRYIAGGGVPRWEAWRRFLSFGGNMYARLVTGAPIRDLTAGFVSFRRQLLARMDLDRISSEGYAYTIESKCLAHRAGARIKEIPIIFEERRGGESKLSRHIIREGIMAPLRIRLRF